MELNPFQILIGIGMVFSTALFLWYGVAFARNMFRFGIPKYQPRDEIVAWCMVMMSSIRHWDYERTPAMDFEHYDLGILSVDEERHFKSLEGVLITRIISPEWACDTVAG